MITILVFGLPDVFNSSELLKFRAQMIGIVQGETRMNIRGISCFLPKDMLNDENGEDISIMVSNFPKDEMLKHRKPRLAFLLEGKTKEFVPVANVSCSIFSDGEGGL